MKRIVCSAFGVMLAVSLAGAQTSQSNTPSGTPLGDYARQIKKPSPTTKPRVFDNDNLPTDDKLSVVGPAAGTTAPSDNSADAKPSDAAAPAASTASVAPSSDGKAQTGKPSSDGKAASGPAALPTVARTAAEEQADRDAANKQWADKLAAQKDQIDLLARELEVSQREYQIRAAAMYADAGNRMRNSTDWDKQDAQYKQQIADKQKALEEAKQKLEDMQEEARKSGVPASVREP